MVKIGLIVPVYKNFEGFTRLVRSVDEPVLPIVIPNWENNLGVSKGWNLGIEQAIEQRCDLALICNDDVILHEGTIAKLRSSVWNLGYDLVSAHGNPDLDSNRHDQHPDFAAFMIKPEEFVAKFGRFDENFTPAYFEDNDMHYRIALAGGNAVNRVDAGMTHAGSVTQNWGGKQVVGHEKFRSNQAYYSLKWGGRPGSEIFNRPFGRADVGVDFW